LLPPDRTSDLLICDPLGARKGSRGTVAASPVVPHASFSRPVVGTPKTIALKHRLPVALDLIAGVNIALFAGSSRLAWAREFDFDTALVKNPTFARGPRR
jgi:hypothetical protein